MFISCYRYAKGLGNSNLMIDVFSDALWEFDVNISNFLLKKRPDYGLDVHPINKKFTMHDLHEREQLCLLHEPLTYELINGVTLG